MDDSFPDCFRCDAIFVLLPKSSDDIPQPGAAVKKTAHPMKGLP